MRSLCLSLLPFFVVSLLPSFSPAQSNSREDLPPRALARLGDYRFYHGDKLGCYAINHDGRRVATGDNGVSAEHDKVIVWDGATGEELRRWQIPGGGISCLDISPDGKRLAVGCCVTKEKPNSLFLYDVDTGKLVHRLAEFKSGVTQVQFSLDGKRLHVSEGNGRWFSDPVVTCWDAVTGKMRQRWTPPEIPPHETDKDYTKWTVQDGRLSVDEEIVFWRMEVEVQTPKGSVDLAKRYGVMRAYDAGSNKQMYELGTADWPHTFSADGKRFVESGSPLVIREAATGKAQRDFGGSNDFRAISLFLPDERRALVFTAHGCRVCDLASGRVLDAPEANGFSQRWDPALISGNGNILVISSTTSWNTRVLRLVNLNTGKESGSLPGHRLPVISLWFSSDGTKLVSQCKDNINEWGVLQPTRVRSIKPFAISEDQSLAARSPSALYDLVTSKGLNYPLGIRDTKTGQVRLSFETKHYGMLQSAAFSPGGDKLAIVLYPGRDGLQWFDVATGKQLGNVPEADCLTTPPILSPDGRWLLWVTRENKICLTDGVSGQLIQSLDLAILSKGDEHRLRLYFLFAFSPDGNYLAAAPDFASVPIRVFRLPAGKEIANFSVYPEKGNEAPAALAFSPDGRLLAVAQFGSNTIRFLEIASGRTRLILSGHRDTPTTLAFSPDGKTLASGGNDNVIYLWDVTGARTKASGKELDESACWEALSGSDAVRPGEALATFMRKPDRSVAFLKEKLRPVAAIDPKRLALLIADLDADDFQKREAASRELAQLGELTETALRQALKAGPAPEAKRRIDELLEKLDNRSLPPETLRALRAIEALEHIGTPEARRLLEALAAGAPEARVTQDAKASVKRLEKRSRP